MHKKQEESSFDTILASMAQKVHSLVPPPKVGKGAGIHCLHMHQIICKFHRKIFWTLVQTHGKIYGVAKRSNYTVHAHLGVVKIS